MVQLIDKSLQLKNAIQNIGLIDRVVRMLVGIAMISTWFFYPVDSVNTWFAILPLLGVFHYCPASLVGAQFMPCSIRNPVERTNTTPVAHYRIN